MVSATVFADKFADKNASTESSLIELTLFKLDLGITPTQVTELTRLFLDEKSFTETDLQLFYFRKVQPLIQKAATSRIPVPSSRTPVTRTIAAPDASDKAKWQFRNWVVHYASRSKGYFKEEVYAHKARDNTLTSFGISALISGDLLADPVRLEHFLDHAETEYGIRPKLPKSSSPTPRAKKASTPPPKPVTPSDVDM